MNPNKPSTPFTRFLTFVALTAVVLLLAACGTNDTAPNSGDIVEAFIGDLSASASASGQIQAVQTAQLAFQANGRVQEIAVRVGDQVSAGDVLAVLESDTQALDLENAAQTLAIRQASLAELQSTPTAAAVANAEAAVASAQARLDTLLAGPSEAEIAAAEANLRAAQSQIWANSASLSGVQNSVTSADLESARAELVAAEYQYEQIREITDEFSVKQLDDQLQSAFSNLEIARARYEAVLSGADENDVLQAQSSISSSVAQRDSVQASLDDLLAGATAAEIASAEAELERVEVNLAQLLDPPAAEDITIAEANVAQAEINLESVQAQLEKMQLVAPFDGVITAVNIQVGEFPSGIALTLANNNTLEVVLSVDELDIGNLYEGQEATITLDSFPDAVLDSRISQISPSANVDPSSDLVTYDVHVTLNDTADLPIRLGMTANAQLLTSERNDVLLVPNRAIRADREAGRYFVNRVTATNDNGVPTTEEVEISIGLRDNQHTEVTSGLSAGDQLLIGSAIPTVNFGPPE